MMIYPEHQRAYHFLLSYAQTASHTYIFTCLIDPWPPACMSLEVPGEVWRYPVWRWHQLLTSLIYSIHTQLPQRGYVEWNCTQPLAESSRKYGGAKQTPINMILCFWENHKKPLQSQGTLGECVLKRHAGQELRRKLIDLCGIGWDVASWQSMWTQGVGCLPSVIRFSV